MCKVTAVFLLGLFALTRGFPTEAEVNSWRIVGGSDASPGDAPYQVSLRVASSNSHHCGGSIISSRTIVTAAHCLMGATPSDLTIVAGSLKLSSGGTVYDVSRIIPHPDSFFLADIGVVITKDNIEFGPNVAPIVLGSSTVGAGVSALVTGWGRTSAPGYNLEYSDHLQKLNLLTISNESCRSVLSTVGPVLDSDVCTYTTFGEGTCQGDSGGPLVADGELIGVVSWGIPCALGYPDVFTRVSSFRDWIIDNSE